MPEKTITWPKLLEALQRVPSERWGEVLEFLNTPGSAKPPWLKRDLGLAQEFQKAILFKKNPKIPSYEIGVHYESKFEIGGDFYDVCERGNNLFTIVMGDVAGLGIPAALIMVKILSDLRWALASRLPLEDAIRKVNDMALEIGKLDRFVTLIAVSIDCKRHYLTLVNAGHIIPWIYRNGALREAHDQMMVGFPLGVAEGIPYEPFQAKLEPCECLIMCTDGVVDAQNSEKEDFGISKIQQCISGCFDKSAQEIVDILIGRVKEHRAGLSPHDDMTLICVKRTAV